MREFASSLVVALLVVAPCAACGQALPPAAPSVPAQSSVRPTVVNPANIGRVRGDLPAGYEFAGLNGPAAPLVLWGFGRDAIADPPQCGSLADPAGEGTVRGWSASGAGGIVYAVVAAARVELDPAVVDACGSWSLSAGHTIGTVTLVAGPAALAVDGAATVGMASDATTRVEGGTETRSHANTFTAYLGDYVAYVTVVTDPGAPGPALDADFAAALLTKTVSALRG